jgi:Ca2+/H+ antiporter, TMEM165/GDT1 family
MGAFWYSLATVFGLELLDKTQLVALCLASRFNAKVVLGGILTATLAVHIVSVILGDCIGALLPKYWIHLASGLAFIGFGLWTLRGDSFSDEECNNIQGRSPFWMVVTTFFLAELGDKTMLGTVALATRYSPIPVWLGSSLGMVISDGLAIVVGQMLGKKLPERPIKVCAAAAFFGFGLFSVVRGGLKLPFFSWIIATAAIAGMLAFYARAARRSVDRVAVDLPDVVAVGEDVRQTP